MVRNTAWVEDIGRWLRLRDLHVFFTVVRCGSMAKAAAALRISQPSISIQIGDLEHALGVSLFDRTPRGVELTSYGKALLQRGEAAFDELRQGIRDIEFLADPTAGEVRVGCSEAIWPGLLPPIIDRMSRKYPRVLLKISHITANPPNLRGLDERELDLVIAPIGRKISGDYKVEVLLNDTVRVIAGAQSRWASRRKIDIAELSDELWIMTPQDTPLSAIIEAAFRASGRPLPKYYLEAYSIHLRNHLVGTGRFVAATLGSVVRLNAEPFGLKALPVALPMAKVPLGVITVKNRTLSPVVGLFLECAREAGQSILHEGRPASRSSQSVRDAAPRSL